MMITQPSVTIYGKPCQIIGLKYSGKFAVVDTGPTEPIRSYAINSLRWGSAADMVNALAPVLPFQEYTGYRRGNLVRTRRDGSGMKAGRRGIVIKPVNGNGRLLVQFPGRGDYEVYPGDIESVPPKVRARRMGRASSGRQHYRVRK